MSLGGFFLTQLQSFVSNVYKLDQINNCTNILYNAT